MSECAVLRSTAEWAARYPSPGQRAVLSVGNFDGLHLGHQKILGRVIECAQAQQGIAGVITFDPHPLQLLRPEQFQPLLTSLFDRAELLHANGADHPKAQLRRAITIDQGRTPDRTARTIAAGWGWKASPETTSQPTACSP